MIALTVYGLSAAATTLPQAGQLTSTGGGGSTTTTTTLIGQSTGYGEIAAQGTTAAWLSGYALPEATGYGFLWDVTTLELQQILAGNWTPTITLSVSANTIVADLYCRIWLYAGGPFVPITPATGNGILLAGQTITTTPAAFAFAAATLPPASSGIKFLTGGKLYIDLWANITTNSTGSNSATLALTLSSNTSGVTGCQFVTPGYQALTGSQLATMYSFGAFCLNDQANYLLQVRDQTFPEVKASTFPVARNPNTGITGYRVDAKSIPATVYVLGNGRDDVKMKVDALYQALALKQQKLSLSKIDRRYWLADALKAPLQFVPGQLNAVKIPVTFLAANPYAYSSVTQTFTTGVVTLSANQWLIAAGGQVPTLPTITVTNSLSAFPGLNLATGLTNGTNYTSLNVSSTVTVGSGDTLLLNDGSGHTQTVTVSTTGTGTTISVNSFQANFSYPSSTTTVRRTTAYTTIQVQQVTDNIFLSVTTLALTPGATLTIVCDPTLTNGETCYISPGTPLSYSGTFPVLEPTSTTWQISALGAVGQFTIDVTWSWQARYVV